VTGEIRDAGAFTQRRDQRTTVPLELAPRGSLFVVFRRPIPPTKNGAGSNFLTYSPLTNLEGAWTVKFDPKWGGPPSVEFPDLVDWTQRTEDGIKYYSGKATYAKSFDLNMSSFPNPKARIFLDLGEVRNVAEVRLNGKSLGVLWTKPFRVEITGTVKSGNNDLEIDIVNLWPNRLIGDANLPEDCEWNAAEVGQTLKAWPRWLLEDKPSPTGRFTFTIWRVWPKDAPLLKSGLLGPVTLQVAGRIT